MRENLATYEALIAEKLEALDDPSATDLWQMATSAFGELQWSLQEGDESGFHAARARLGQILEKGVDRSNTISELRRLILEQAQVAKVEIARENKAENMITVREMMTVMSFLLAILKEEIKDKRIYVRVAQRITEAVPSGVEQILN